MATLGEFADQVAAVASRMRETLARDVAQVQAETFLGIEKSVTPKRSGHLAGSETVDSVTGGGEHAVAYVSPHAVYARFRNEGGTITKHSPGSLGTPAVGFFGHSVTQRGAHYVEHAEGLAHAALTAVAESVADGYLEGL